MDISDSKQAIKYLTKMDNAKKLAVINKIKQLPLGDVKTFINHPKVSHRLRVGGIRVLFRMNDTMITIAKIGNRGDIYK